MTDDFAGSSVMKGAPRILVVDDDELARAALYACLSHAGFDAELFASPLEVLEYIDNNDSGCVVTDVRMSPIDGVELAQRLREKAPNVDVIVISAHGDIPLAVRAMKAGARDFVEKSEGYEALVAAILELTPRAVDPVDPAADIQERRETLRRMQTLSPRELEILAMVGAGKTGRQMAEELGISARTVEAHRRSTMLKMGALRLGHLVRMATLARR